MNRWMICSLNYKVLREAKSVKPYLLTSLGGMRRRGNQTGRNKTFFTEISVYSTPLKTQANTGSHGHSHFPDIITLTRMLSQTLNELTWLKIKIWLSNLGVVDWVFVSPQNSYIETLPLTMVLGGGGLGMWLGLDEVTRVGLSWMGLVPL